MGLRTSCATCGLPLCPGGSIPGVHLGITAGFWDFPKQCYGRIESRKCGQHHNRDQEHDRDETDADTETKTETALFTALEPTPCLRLGYSNIPGTHCP